MISIVGFLGHQTSKNILISEIENRFINNAKDALNIIDIVMHRNYHDVYSFSQSPIFQEERSIAEITDRMKKWQEQYSYESLSYFNMDRIRLADTEGIGIGKQHPLEGFWNDVLQGNVSAGSDVRMGPEREIPIIYFAAPVINSEGQQIGVVVARYDPKEINNIVAAAAEKSKREMAEKMAKELEGKVKERTGELQDAVTRLKASEQQQKAANHQLSAAQKNLQDKLLELERFNKVAVGRELKMVELKEEIARLKAIKQ